MASLYRSLIIFIAMVARSQVCEGLLPFGIDVDSTANAISGRLAEVQSQQSKVKVSSSTHRVFLGDLHIEWVERQHPTAFGEPLFTPLRSHSWRRCPSIECLVALSLRRLSPF